jgi:hypothetical protein
MFLFAPQRQYVSELNSSQSERPNDSLQRKTNLKRNFSAANERK